MVLCVCFSLKWQNLLDLLVVVGLCNCLQIKSVYKTSLVQWQIESIWDNNLYFMRCPEWLPRLFQEPVLPKPRRIQAKFLPNEVNGRFTDHLMTSGSDLIWLGFSPVAFQMCFEFRWFLTTHSNQDSTQSKVYKVQGKWAWSHYLWCFLAAADPSWRAVFSFQTRPSPGSGTAAAPLGVGARLRVSVSLRQTACD